MNKTNALLLASFLSLGCGESKTTSVFNEINTSLKDAPNNPTPTPDNDPFKGGFCEVSIDGAAPKKNPSSFNTKYWGDQVPWAISVFCDGFEMVGYGDDTSMPAKPGKYPFYQPGGPKVGVFAILGADNYYLTGEVNIEVWDDKTIKGTFEAKGSYGTKGTSGYKESVTFKGSFEHKKINSAPRQPFMSGTCELVVNDGIVRYEPGNQFALSTAYWAGPNTKNPSWALQLNCGKYGLSAGKTSDLPMKPGKYKIGQDGPISILSPLSMASGELTIDSWDMLGIKGSFEVKGPIMFATDPTPVIAKGTFDYKCPYTKPGEPCLEKPNTP